MNHLLPVALVLFALTLPCHAQAIDVNQPNAPTCMSGTWQDDLAQSFQPTTTNCAGAGFFMTAGIGGTDDIEIKLYDALPNMGGAILASGNALGNPGAWVEVFWPAVSVVPGQTYYLVVGANFGSMCLAGDTNNPYPGGICYANSPFQAWPNYDYTFHTWTQDRPILSTNGSCPLVTIDVSFGTPSGQLALITSANYGFFVIPGGSCAGSTLQLANPTLRAVKSLDSLGSLQLQVNLPAGACGSLLLEALDLGSCRASDVVPL